MRTNLLAQSISYDTRLCERWVFVKSVRKDIIRHIIAEVTNKQTEPRFEEF